MLTSLLFRRVEDAIAAVIRQRFGHSKLRFNRGKRTGNMQLCATSCARFKTFLQLKCHIHRYKYSANLKGEEERASWIFPVNQ